MAEPTIMADGSSSDWRDSFAPSARDTDADFLKGMGWLAITAWIGGLGWVSIEVLSALKRHLFLDSIMDKLLWPAALLGVLALGIAAGARWFHVGNQNWQLVETRPAALGMTISLSIAAASVAATILEWALNLYHLLP